MQARFLLAKLNPSATHQTDQGAMNEIIFTEDVSLEVSCDLILLAGSVSSPVLAWCIFSPVLADFP